MAMKPARRLLTAAFAALTLTATAACGAAEDDTSKKPVNAAAVLGPSAPAKGEPVRIGVVTGKAATGQRAVERDVAEATIKYLNARKSGIGGRPIELFVCDTTADPSTATDCANRMIQDRVAGVVIGSTSVAESVWDPLHAAGIPTMLFAASDAPVLRDAKSTFVLSDPVFANVTLPIELAKDADEKTVTTIVVDVPTAVGLYSTVAPPVYAKAGIEHTVIAVPLDTADMTPQLQKLAKGDPGIVHVVGNDSFCVAAFSGLRAVGFTGKIHAAGPCITDATRKATPKDQLEGMTVSAATPLGTDNPSMQLYEAVAATYGKDIDLGSPAGMSLFSTITAFHAALQNLTGEVTPQSVTAAIKAAPKAEMPGAQPLTFQCNGSFYPATPAVCLRGGLIATLDEKGKPEKYDARGTEPAGS
ncbi:ABC transporter substrate-binding protein [Cryptosporangium aurantiacum]|uniref:ABC-type branched-chain amino acid transport system, substrate-binding protein n=1 Tax=Cryptosporangium aurantiacum TaxID=134849 RepID=A0A1M7RG35_9ACTN|nr:ABC transporter substrate-binding protein [Cryptosporangium aurantiacum]SHN45255.1 ABC-type branched-chain amino acid transport system, substrate-binding protein [Cryptosporangium aurantiacum]